MASQSSRSTNTGRLSLNQQGPIVRIIDKLAGEQANLEIIVQDLTFNVGESKHTLNGRININVFHAEEELHKPQESGNAES